MWVDMRCSDVTYLLWRNQICKTFHWFAGGYTIYNNYNMLGWFIWCRIQSSRWYWRPDVLSFRKCHVISHRGWSSSFSTFTSDAHIWSSTLLTRYACLSIIDFKQKRHMKTKRKESQLILFKNIFIIGDHISFIIYGSQQFGYYIDSRLLPVAMHNCI